MIKMTVSLPDTLVKTIKSLAAKEEESTSVATRTLLELGCQTKQTRENQTNKREAEEKTPEYLLRILNLCGEIYRFTFDNDRAHVVTNTDDPEMAIRTIKEAVKKYLDEDNTPTE